MVAKAAKELLVDTVTVPQAHNLLVARLSKPPRVPWATAPEDLVPSRPVGILVEPLLAVRIAGEVCQVQATLDRSTAVPVWVCCSLLVSAYLY